MYAINAQSGAPEGAFRTAGPVLSSPAVVAGATVAVGSNDGEIYAITGFAAAETRTVR